MSPFHPATKPTKLHRYTPAQSRFWAQVDKQPADPEYRVKGCWKWTGGTDEHGYGRIRRNGKQMHAQVFAWELFNGPMPAGKWGLHTCDHPACVNPEHVYPGTQTENMRDLSVRQRRVGEVNGRAKLTTARVLQIRAMAASGKRNYSRIAKMFNVTNALIGKIVRRELWKHI